MSSRQPPASNGLRGATDREDAITRAYEEGYQKGLEQSGGTSDRAAVLGAAIGSLAGAGATFALQETVDGDAREWYRQPSNIYAGTSTVAALTTAGAALAAPNSVPPALVSALTGNAVAATGTSLVRR